MSVRDGDEIMADIRAITVRNDALEDLAATLTTIARLPALKDLSISNNPFDVAPRNDDIRNPFKASFASIGKDLPNIILGALQGGGNIFKSAESFGGFDALQKKLGELGRLRFASEMLRQVENSPVGTQGQRGGAVRVTNASINVPPWNGNTPRSW